MRDTVIEDYAPGKSPVIKLCIRCKTEFPFRANKKFCTTNCRRRHGEVKQNSFMSNETRRRNMEFFERAARMAERLFMLPPPHRPDHLSEIIEKARSGEDTSLRDLLSNKVLLDPSNSWGNHLRGNRGRSYGSIAQAAEAHCREYWNASVRDVVYCRKPE